MTPGEGTASELAAPVVTAVAVHPQTGGTGTHREDGGTGVRYLLGLRNFRLLWFGTFFTGLAVWLQAPVINYLSYEFSNSGTMVGLVILVRSLPNILLSPVAGVLADRVQRRPYMLAINLCQVSTAALMGLGLFIGVVGIYQLMLFALAVGIWQVLMQPAQQTVIFDVVPRQAFPNAIGLTSVANNVSQVIGPSISGFVIAGLGTDGNFFLQSIVFLGVTVTFVLLAFPPRGSGTARVLKESATRNFTEGILFVGREKTVRAVLLLGLAQPLLIMPMLFSMMPIVAKDVFHTGPGGLGLMVSCYGIGGLLAAVLVSNLRRVERGGLLQMVGLAGAGSGFLGLSLAPSLQLGLGFLVLAGFGALVFQTANQTILQLIVPQEMRGRMTSFNILSMGVYPVGSIATGTLADYIGARNVEHITGSLAIAVALGALLLVPRLRNLRLSQLAR